MGDRYLYGCRQHGAGAAVGAVCPIDRCRFSVTLSLDFACFFKLLIESLHREAGT